MLCTSEIYKPIKPLSLGLQAVEILNLLLLFWILALIKYSESLISEVVLGTFPGAQTGPSHSLVQFTCPGEFMNHLLLLLAHSQNTWHVPLLSTCYSTERLIWMSLLDRNYQCTLSTVKSPHAKHCKIQVPFFFCVINGAGYWTITRKLKFTCCIYDSGSVEISNASINIDNQSSKNSLLLYKTLKVPMDAAQTVWIWCRKLHRYFLFCVFYLKEF